MKLFTRLLTLTCIFLILSGCSRLQDDSPGQDSEGGSLSSKEERLLQIAKTTPEGKYPSLVTYTLAKMTGANNSNMPGEDTYEDNAYTRYLREHLNIQNENVFEEKDDQYYITLDMAISSGRIPDVMVVEDAETVAELAEKGIIQDLTESYENCASQVIKDIYDSYGEAIFEPVTIDGKLMAIPETNISEGPNLIWLRKDWMESLGLEAPRDLPDLEYIVGQFLEHHMGGQDTVGIVCDTTLCGETGYSSQYQLDIIFASFGAFPKQWIRDGEGKVCYGSVQPQVKDALSYIHGLYEKGILDQDFLLRTNVNLIDLVVSGTCGAFFGPWWAPNNPLMDAMEADGNADWEPYLLATDPDGTTRYHSQNPSYKYVVVRSGFAYPEVVCKMISILFDYSRYQDVDNEELAAYYALNVDPTARPIAINVDYNTALEKCYDMIQGALEGQVEVTDMPLLERAYYRACQAYLEDPGSASLEEWAAYESRIVACRLLTQENIVRVDSLFFGETETMRGSWWKLRELENQAYLKIISGEEDISYFDTFVEEWKAGGGEQILREVEEKLDGR